MSAIKATREKVFATASQQQSDDITPTIDTIRASIGGSPNTIGPHLAAWKEANAATLQQVEQAQVSEVERAVHQVLEKLAKGSAAAQARAVEAESQAAEARQLAEQSRLKAIQAETDRDFAISAAARVTNTAREVAELRVLLAAERAERQRDRKSLIAMRRQIAALSASQ